ncbi:MAG TPA: Uma2 family endonuclease [Labilithrix sp.]|nr:Uma2 family endonuclease [Labilithrix sp.]
MAQLAVEQPRLIRREEYETMVSAGLFHDERVELLYGVIVRMGPKGPPHESAIEHLTELLVSGLAGRATVRIQSSFAASSGSEPEPDVAVVPRGDYSARHPDVAHLLIEVADSSLPTDRGTKATLYAECGVPEYWVVNVRDSLVEVFTEIVNGAYTRVVPYRRGDSVAPLAFPDLLIAIADVI